MATGRKTTEDRNPNDENGDFQRRSEIENAIAVKNCCEKNAVKMQWKKSLQALDYVFFIDYQEGFSG